MITNKLHYMVLHPATSKSMGGWCRPEESVLSKEITGPGRYVVPVDANGKLFNKYEVAYVHKDDINTFNCTEAIVNDSLMGVTIADRLVWFQTWGFPAPYLGSLKHPNFKLNLVELNPGMLGAERLDQILNDYGYVIIGYPHVYPGQEE